MIVSIACEDDGATAAVRGTTTGSAVERTSSGVVVDVIVRPPPDACSITNYSEIDNNGNTSTMMETTTSLTWFEEWFVFFWNSLGAVASSMERCWARDV